MSNRPARLQVISGLPVTGVMGMMSEIITGCPAYGSLRRRWVCFGHRPGGAGTTVYTRLTRVTGDQQSVFTEALITVMATQETATGADDGVETISSTTPL